MWGIVAGVLDVLHTIGDGVVNAAMMAYEVWWALVLGFLVSAVVQAWIPRERIEASLSGGGARPVGLATGLGAASSSCSYAAVAIAKSLFQKGASAASALAFQFASTNLVWELGLVLWVLIGWQFALAEFVGGLVMIALMAISLRAFVSPRLEAQAREHAQAAATGHEHHAAGSDLPWSRRLRSAEAWSDVAHNFRGDWQMLWKEVGDRLPARRLHRPAADGRLQRAVRDRRPAARCATIENVARRAAHRRAELRLLDRQRPARRRAVVRRHLVLRGARVPLRRPDRAADRRDLPQVLRDRVRAADHGAHARRDGARRARRRRRVLGDRPRPDDAAVAPTTSSAPSASTTSSS